LRFLRLPYFFAFSEASCILTRPQRPTIAGELRRRSLASARVCAPL